MAMLEARLIRHQTPGLKRLGTRNRITLWRYGKVGRNYPVVLICRYGKYSPRVIHNTLPWQERRVARFFIEARKRDWQMGRWLIHQALSIHGNHLSARYWIDRGACGAPLLRGAPGPRLAISHTEGWVGAALHRSRPIGLDLECGQMSSGATRYFLSAGETRALGGSANFPMNAWVTKEAAYKALHCDSSLHLKDLTLQARPQAPGQQHQTFLCRRTTDGKQLHVGYRRFVHLNINFGLAIL